MRASARRDRKTAPFVEIDHHDRIRPWRARDHRVIDGIQEGLAIADIGVRMVIVREPLGLAQKARIDVGDGGERPGGTIEQELGGRPGDVDVLGAPEREDRDVTEVVAARDPFLRKAIPDGR